MKYTIFLLGAVAATLASCVDQLDKTPQSSLSPSTYFKTAEQLELYSNQFYLDMIPAADAIYGDNADAIIITPLSDAVSGQRVVPGSAKEGGWNWEPLRRINFLLENSVNCPDEAARHQYDGLARFFRAYFYFEKVKLFGDVPWYGNVLGSTDEDLYKPRDPRKLVMDSVLSDLDYAIENLPAEKDVYRVTKWTALALKSRAALFEGTFRKYHDLGDETPFLEACVDASEQLMNESGYSLYKTGSTPYQDLFASQDARSEEVILARNFDGALGLFQNVQPYENSSTLRRPGLSKKMVNAYLTSQGTRFTDQPGYATMAFYDETRNRDPRLAQTIRTPGYKRVGGTATVAPNLAFTLTGYHLTKYSVEASYDQTGSAVDMPVFRLGEVYLNLAEAKAELGTLTQADLDRSIKLLRDRVSMPNLDMAAANANPDPYLRSAETGYPNVSAQNTGVILEIRRERAVELAMEGFRYYDLMRWKEGKAFEKPFLGMYIPGPGTYDLDRDGKDDVCFYTGTKPVTSAPLVLELNSDVKLTQGTSGNILCQDQIVRKWDEDKDYLYPIPIEERSLSGGVLTQNPGWNDGLNF